ncbi:MAG: metal ABC transporter permease [Planctomycetota bacterium]
MIRFFADLADNPFLLTGLLAGMLASVGCGLVGPYVIARRIVFLVGAIAHMAVGGVGAAIFLSHHVPALAWVTPEQGAMVVAVAAAIVLGIVNHRARDRIDTLIGALWAIGMSVGLLLIEYTPGYHVELMSFLFGNIAFVPASSVIAIGILDVVIVAAVLALHKRLLAVCLDEEHASLQGINVLAVNILLLVLVALTVICLIRVVGLILVLALLTLPAATAGHHLRRLGPMMWTSALLCAGLTTIPRMAVYGTRISPEAAIVLAAAGVYLVSLGVRRARRRRVAGT